MKNTTIKSALIALALLLGATPALCQDKPGTAGPAASQSAKKETKKAAQPVKSVDINSASKAELKKLPGIGDAEADRIIAGRPYLTKAELATRKLIPEGVFVQIKGQIIAMQKLEPPAKAAGKKG